MQVSQTCSSAVSGQLGEQMGHVSNSFGDFRFFQYTAMQMLCECVTHLCVYVGGGRIQGARARDDVSV